MINFKIKEKQQKKNKTREQAFLNYFYQNNVVY